MEKGTVLVTRNSIGGELKPVAIARGKIQQMLDVKLLLHQLKLSRHQTDSKEREKGGGA
jgi:hypothetical protein